MLGIYNWRVLTHRSPSTADRHNLCVGVDIAVAPEAAKGGTGLSSCGSIARFPNVVAFGSNAAGTEITIGGVVLDRKVHRIKAYLSNGHVVWRNPQLVSLARARGAALAPFRFATFVFHGCDPRRLEGARRRGRRSSVPR